jgi:uncharacterized protein YceK
MFVVVFLISGCGVFFRNIEEQRCGIEPEWAYRSVIQDSRIISRVWLGESWIPGLESQARHWDYYCFGVPAATLIYLVDMPLCFIVDTVLFPYDLWYAITYTN